VEDNPDYLVIFPEVIEVEDAKVGQCTLRLIVTKCVKALRAKAKRMDQSQARIKTVPSRSEPVIGRCFLLLLLLVKL
jgi:hypothetical protein